MVGAVSPVRLIAVMCVGQVIGHLGFTTFPALLPVFFAEWGLTNTEAGWINGIYFAGYVAAVPVLVGLTDRLPAAPIYLSSVALTGLSGLGFGLLAEGFWSAMALRTLAGIGLAGFFMPGLKFMIDRLDDRIQGRAVAFYGAAFGIGSSLSFFIAGEVEAWLDWRWAFAATAVGPAIQIALVLATLPMAEDTQPAKPRTRLLDFRPVFRCRAAMAYIIGYTVHGWEHFAFRSWTVAFLAFAQDQHPGEGPPWSPTVWATVINLIGVPSIILGGEMGVRFGRRRALFVIMGISAVLACTLGFAVALPLWVLTGLLCIYGVVLIADAPALTAGAVANAPEGYRGATMAVHSCLGFAGGFAGPLAVGMVLDAAGGADSVLSWGLAFASLGVVVALGPLALALLGGAGGSARS